MKVNINVPNTKKDIKLSQYQKFVKTTKDSEDEAFILRQMVGIFCNIPDSVVNNMTVNDFNDVTNTITKALEEKSEFKPRFVMDDIEYGFIPDLENITVGEKADLDSYYRDIDTMHKAMGVLYRPIKASSKKGYLIEDYEGKGNSLDPTLDIVFGANVFFSSLMNDLLNYTQNSIAHQVAHSPKVSQTLEQNGVGTVAFMNSLAETFSSLRALAN